MRGSERSELIYRLGLAVSARAASASPAAPIDLSAYIDPDEGITSGRAKNRGRTTAQIFASIQGSGLAIIQNPQLVAPEPPKKQGDIMATGQGTWRITAPINNEFYGYTTSVVTQVSEDVQKVNAVADGWIDKFCDMFGSDLTSAQITDPTKGSTGSAPRCEMMRIVDVNNNRIGYSRPVAPFAGRGRGTDFTNSEADVFTTALMVRLPGRSSQPVPQTSYHNLFIAGQPDAVVSGGRYDDRLVMFKDGPTSKGITFREFLARFLTYLTDPVNKLGFLGIDKTVKPTLAASVGTREVFNDLVITSPNHGLINGDVVSIQGQAGKYRGTWKVIAISSSEFALSGSEYSLKSKPTFVKWRKIRGADGSRNVVFYQFQAPDGGWLTNPPYVKLTKKTPGRKIVPISFKHKGNKAR